MLTGVIAARSPQGLDSVPGRRRPGVLLHASRRASRCAFPVGAAEGVIAGDVIEALPRARGTGGPGGEPFRAREWLTRRRSGRGAASARARASVNLAALERNCAGCAASCAAAPSCARSSRPTGTATAHCPARARRSPAARAGSRSSSGEALELREGGLTDVPVLVMGALDAGELERALSVGADVVVWREDQVRAVADAGGGRVHVKLDSGMGRLGTREAGQATSVVGAGACSPGVVLAGLMTHFATADERDDDGFFEQQLRTFTSWAAPLKREQPELVVHAANSAAVLRNPEAHFDLVRCGISIYGMDPFGVDPPPGSSSRCSSCLLRGGREAVRARAERRLRAHLPRPCGHPIALLPIGYGDGWRRSLSNNAEVLIGGRRYPLAGTVSMDSVAVEVGDGALEAGCAASGRS